MQTRRGSNRRSFGGQRRVELIKDKCWNISARWLAGSKEHRPLWDMWECHWRRPGEPPRWIALMVLSKWLHLGSDTRGNGGNDCTMEPLWPFTKEEEFNKLGSLPNFCNNMCFSLSYGSCLIPTPSLFIPSEWITATTLVNVQQYTNRKRTLTNESNIGRHAELSAGVPKPCTDSYKVKNYARWLQIFHSTFCVQLLRQFQQNWGQSLIIRVRGLGTGKYASNTLQYWHCLLYTVCNTCCLVDGAQPYLSQNKTTHKIKQIN